MLPISDIDIAIRLLAIRRHTHTQRKNEETSSIHEASGLARRADRTAFVSGKTASFALVRSLWERSVARLVENGV